MSEGGRIDRARARSTDAKQRLKDTLGALKQRLDPHRVAKEAVEGLVDQGTQVLQSGVETAKRNPVPLVGAAAFFAAFFNRKRLSALIWRRRAPKSKKEAAPKPAATQRVRSTNSRRPPSKRTSQ